MIHIPRQGRSGPKAESIPRPNVFIQYKLGFRMRIKVFSAARRNAIAEVKGNGVAWISEEAENGHGALG